MLIYHKNRQDLQVGAVVGAEVGAVVGDGDPELEFELDPVPSPALTLIIKESMGAISFNTPDSIPATRTIVQLEIYIYAGNW